MKQLIEYIKDSTGHKIFLGVMIALFVIAAVLKMTSTKPVMSMRQAQIEAATEGFRR